MTIFTDAKGVPIDPPKKPAEDAPFSERLDYMRAYWAWKDLITDLANKAFDQQFTQSLSKLRRN